ncbi:MAG TPA: ABC transporter permease [Haliangium sp.]|nr:ABC transporter permease [Haliangium sp.]
MLDIDGWQEILTTLRRNKLRTALTAIGVIWGIFILIVMIGVGSGLETGVTRRMSGFAHNSIYFWGQRTTMPHAGMQPGRRVEFDNRDVQALAGIEGIEHLAPRNQLGGFRESGVVRRGNQTGSFNVMGDYPALRYIESIRMSQGRFLNDLDVEERRKIAVVGRQVVDQLFEPGEDPIGQAIQINGVYFQVVGAFDPFQTGEQADRQAQNIFVPFTTFQQAFNFGDRVGWFSLTIAPGHTSADVEAKVRRVLAARHRIAPEDEQAIGSYNAEKDFGKVQNLFTGINAIIWFAGVMTLLAGVIGVINIMLISVKERTREIGVRKALGATQRSIVGMILRESVLLTSLAGCIGILAGVAVIEQLASQGIESEMFAAPTVGFTATVLATCVLVVSGAIAGFLPAMHAAGIDPVEALRAE